MKTVTIAHPVNHSPHGKFGLHPLAFYSAHVLAAPCRRDLIHVRTLLTYPATGTSRRLVSRQALMLPAIA
jgi:hypothetical protein